MTTSSARILLPAASLMLGLFLSGCNDDNGNNGLLKSGTAGEIAVRQIETASCEERSPQDLTDVVVRDSEEAVDIERIVPDCS